MPSLKLRRDEHLLESVAGMKYVSRAALVTDGRATDDFTLNRHLSLDIVQVAGSMDLVESKAGEGVVSLPISTFLDIPSRRLGAKKYSNGERNSR